MRGRIVNRFTHGIVAMLLVGAAAAAARAGELAPSGTLRATFIAANPVQATIDPATGEVRGPAADLVRELARRQGIPFTIAGVPTVQAVIESVKTGAADIGFVAFDPVRAVEVDFSQPYSLAHNTYLVLAGSPIRSVADVDRPGIRIGVGARDAGDYFLTRTLKHAEIRRNPTGALSEALRMLTAGEIDAYAANRQRLTAVASQQPGLRVLPDNFYGVEQAIIVAKGHPARLEILDRFIEEARGAGFIRAAIERAGLVGVDVAPPRAR